MKTCHMPTFSHNTDVSPPFCDILCSKSLPSRPGARFDALGRGPPCGDETAEVGPDVKSRHMLTRRTAFCRGRHRYTLHIPQSTVHSPQPTDLRHTMRSPMGRIRWPRRDRTRQSREIVMYAYAMWSTHINYSVYVMYCSVVKFTLCLVVRKL